MNFRNGNTEAADCNLLLFSDFIDRALATQIYCINKKYNIDYKHFMYNISFSDAIKFMKVLDSEIFKAAASNHKVLEKLYLVYYEIYSKKITLENEDISIIYNLICKNYDINNEKLIKLIEYFKNPYYNNEIGQINLEFLINFLSAFDDGLDLFFKISDLGIPMVEICAMLKYLDGTFKLSNWDSSVQEEFIDNLYQYVIECHAGEAEKSDILIKIDHICKRMHFKQKTLMLINNQIIKEQSFLKDAYKILANQDLEALQEIIANWESSPVIIDDFVRAFLLDDLEQLESLRTHILHCHDKEVINRILNQIATEAKRQFDAFWMRYDLNHDAKDDNHNCIKNNANSFLVMHNLFETAYSFKSGLALIAKLDSLGFTFEDIKYVITINKIVINKSVYQKLDETTKSYIINELFTYISNINNKGDLNVDQLIEIAYKKHYFNTYIKPLAKSDAHNINKIYQSLSINELSQLKKILASHSSPDYLLEAMHQFIQKYSFLGQDEIIDLIFDDAVFAFSEMKAQKSINSIDTAINAQNKPLISIANVDKNAELKNTESQPKEGVQEDENIDGSSINSHLDSQLNTDVYSL